MAWWQKKLLHYALARTGLLEDKAIDPKNLDITLGRKNVVELKDVGLNIKRISKLAQLPPCLRLETARVLSLRLTVPADIYQSSIVAEADGVELTVRLEESINVKSPQHRKAHRRLHSPPPYDPGGLSGSDDEVHIPTTQELAKSFLLDESARERQQLAASLAIHTKGVDESIVSESDDGDDLGVGAAVGLPGFLAGFLQGIVDRLQVHVRNVEIRVETQVAGDGQDSVPITLRLRVGAAELEQLATATEKGQDCRRHVKLQDIAVDLLSDATVFSELSEVPTRTSPADSKRSGPSTLFSAAASPASVGLTSSPTEHHFASVDGLGTLEERLADAQDDVQSYASQMEHSELDIQAGDDNISWGSRRRQTSVPSDDLWNSMASEDVLPDSFLLQRETMRKSSPSSIADTVDRARRAVSPYDRSLQSQKYWPGPVERPERPKAHQSPGSWPTMDQSQQSTSEPFTPGPDDEQEDPMDNKRAALEASTPEHQVSASLAGSVTPPRPAEDRVDEMAESRFYSHEEAESLYMSAMTQKSSTVAQHVPGGWDAELSQIEASTSSEGLHEGQLDTSAISGEGDQEDPRQESGNATPRAPSPEIARDTLDQNPLTAKRLFSVDAVSLWLPIAGDEDAAASSASDSVSSKPIHAPRPTPRAIPGTFSASSELAASQRRGTSSLSEDSRSVLWSTPPTKDNDHRRREVEIDIGDVVGTVDLASCRLLYALTLAASRSLTSVQDSSVLKTKAPHSADVPSSKPTPVSVAVQSLQLALFQELTYEQPQPQDASLFALACERANFRSSASDIDIRVGQLRCLLSGNKLLSFNRDAKLSSSVVMSEDTPDLLVAMNTDKTTIKGRPIREVYLETLPIILLLDLVAVDDTLMSFGGLSGVLDLSSSLLSEGGLLGSPISAGKPSKGVRFQDDPFPVATGPELKVNAQIGNVDVTLRGDSGEVNLRTTAIKTVYREHGASATIEHIQLTGPYQRHTTGAPISVDIFKVRLDQLLEPQDKDLERLLSLLTPSRDKYDNDDDILIETLLRQRRKGGLARVSIADVKVKIVDFDSVHALTGLSGELSKLAAVAKYLPEDDRPGLLTLLRVKDFEAQLPINDRFGKLQVVCQDFLCAQVGLPSLLALSLGSIRASRMGYTDLVHPLVPPTGAEGLPMLMARMLGDEAEPTIKVKLYNACFEYSVPTILALTGMDVGAAPEELVTELAKSIADFAFQREDSDVTKSSPPSDSSRVSAKRTKIELLVHDSALGLTPEKLPAKGLLVLTDARVSALVPSEPTLAVTLELRKAAVFVTDDSGYADIDMTPAGRGSPNNTTTSIRLAAALSKRGYVSVGSIMSAKITARVEDCVDSQSKSVDVDVRNELLLLETCADSTQTLFAIFGGLAPPSPPSKQPKYLTQPMTIEDMMASFTGEPEAKPETRPQTLFDVEEESEMLLDAPTLHMDNDDLLMQSEMTSSLYGPISGIFGGLGQPEDDDTGTADSSETVESLLEEDPFEMTEAPADTVLSDNALMRELRKQCKPSTDGASVDLGLYEIEDLGFDALGAGQQALGSQHRFNTPAVQARRLVVGTQLSLPFKLRMRDVHVIWNIHDGYDWQRTRDGITQAVEQVEARAEERKARRRQSLQDHADDESVIGDVLFNSIYIGVPGNQDAQELRRQINRGIDDLASETESVPISGTSRPTAYSASGRLINQSQRRRLKLERSKTHKIAFELKGVSADLLVFPPDSGDVVSSVDVRVRDLEIFDNVPTSTWRKFLTRQDSDPATREMAKPMAHIELQNVRTLENFAAAEMVIHASLLPLRLHVDQDALDFITRFFEFKDDSMPDSDDCEQPFVQRIEIDTVDLRLDYKPKRIDYGGLRSGHTSEFKNIVTLDAADIRLRHAIVYGLRGFAPLHQTLNDIWLPDVMRNQLPTVLSGLAPVRSLVNIGTGMRDVIAIPIREYRKDGRIVRSIQKGALHFGKTTTSELARLGAKLAIGTQNLLQGAEGLLSPLSDSPSTRPGLSRRVSSDQGWHDTIPDGEDHEERAISAYANQPLGIFSGLRTARRQLEYDLLTAKDAFIAIQGEVFESSSPGAMAAAVAKRAPTVILRPVIGATKAVGTALLGVGNQIDRENLRRVEDKYKRS
ncbi:hypothetical protein LTR08_000313 [Meristemomyces frigidus]|nr:hypothetical protein LTR08_000313 [Meristemomyces frigidus]